MTLFLLALQASPDVIISADQVYKVLLGLFIFCVEHMGAMQSSPSGRQETCKFS